MSYLCPHCNSFPLEDYVWWVSVGKPTKWWCAICGEKYDWKQPNRLLAVQTGESVHQAKVFKAHAAPQGLCGNLISAPKLLANQQEDGDGLLQNIVTNFCEGSRKGLTEELRKFTQVDDHRAREVRHLGEGLGSLLLRYEGRNAQSRGSWYIEDKISTSTTLKKERWGPLLVDYDWNAFCQALFKGHRRRRLGESCMDSYKEMSRAVGVKKLQEAQKAKAFSKMKAAKDAGEEYYDPEREDNILGRNETH